MTLFSLYRQVFFFVLATTVCNANEVMVLWGGLQPNPPTDIKVSPGDVIVFDAAPFPLGSSSASSNNGAIESYDYRESVHRHPSGTCDDTGSIQIASESFRTTHYIIPPNEIPGSFITFASHGGGSDGIQQPTTSACESGLIMTVEVVASSSNTTTLPTGLPTALPTSTPIIPPTTSSTTPPPSTEPTSPSPTPSPEAASNNNNAGNIRISNVMNCPMNNNAAEDDQTSGCSCDDGSCDMRECTMGCSCVGGNCCMSSDCANASSQCQCFGSECTFGDKNCVHATSTTTTTEETGAEAGGGTSGFSLPDITPAPIIIPTDPPLTPPTPLPPTSTPPISLPQVPDIPTGLQPSVPPPPTPTPAPMQLTSGGGGPNSNNNNQNFMDCPENPADTSDCFCIQGSCDMRECTFSCSCPGGNCCLSSECQSDAAAMCDCPTNDCSYGANDEDCLTGLSAGLLATGGGGGDTTSGNNTPPSPAPTPLIRYPNPEETEIEQELSEERTAMERRNLIIGIISCSVVFLLAGYCCYTTVKEEPKKRAWGFNRPGRAVHNDKAPLMSTSI